MYLILHIEFNDHQNSTKALQEFALFIRPVLKAWSATNLLLKG
jgi:hypothetical protein